MIEVIRYEKKYSKIWNDFLLSSKNGTFMFNRNFMEYHSDRFIDHSLIVFRDGKPLGIFPAAEKESKVISSHNGLTYGGIIVDYDADIFDVFTIFYNILKYYNFLGFKKIFYKCIPAFYHRKPAFEDQYAIFLLNGKLVRLDTYFTVKISNTYNLQIRRERGIKKAIQEKVSIAKDDELEEFWLKVLGPNLKSRFNVKPAHSIEEIQLLKNRFPKNIIQYNAIYKGNVVAGTTIFIKDKVAHAQYISGNDIGRKIGAIDFLFYNLINKEFKNYDWFSFGSVNENDGKVLNIGLTQWKEGFGAVVFPHYFYLLETENYILLEQYIKI
jgi:hypothetical protein